MADREQLKKLLEEVHVWNAWRDENPDVEIDLRGANLSTADLTDANLPFADLTGVRNLETAELAGADYTFADGLEGTILDINQPPPDVLPAP